MGSVIIGVLTFLQIMASAAVSSFTPALSENTAVRWNTVKADGLLRVLNIQVMPSSRYLAVKGNLSGHWIHLFLYFIVIFIIANYF